MVPLVSVDNVEGIKRTFEGNRVSQEKIDVLADRIEQWHAEGIKVFGFRPPTSVRIAEMEDEFSGYKLEEIRQRFEAAGGIWLETEPGTYTTYDGHHLTGNAARQFSNDLAAQMMQSGWLSDKGVTPTEHLH